MVEAPPSLIASPAQAVVAPSFPNQAAPDSAPQVPATVSSSHPENIVDRLAAFIGRFVFLKESSLYRLLALWVIHTYLMDVFDHTGYVFAHSPEPESGKTRLLEILDVLVEASSQILTSPTEAVLFHTAKGKTQLLDEVDTWTNSEYLKGILNSGSRRGGTVIRMQKKSQKGDYKAQEFPVFGARALSGIGMQILPEATRTRTFSISMVRQTRQERRERFRSRLVKPHAVALVAEIRAWLATHRTECSERYSRPFPYLDRFSDRTIDVCEPLAAVLEVAYQDSTELDRVRLDFLAAIATTREERAEPIREHRILVALRAQAQVDEFLGGPLIGTASELASRCGKSGVGCSEHEVSRALRNYGFESKSIRKEDGSKRRYSLSGVALEEVLARYLRGSENESADAGTTEATTAEIVEMAGG